jgi:long-chain acyl-CoA synthetase
VKELPDDLVAVRPTVLVSVPRIFERVYGRVRRGAEEKGRMARLLLSWAERAGWERFEEAQGRGAGRSLPCRLAWPLLRKLVAGKITRRLGGRLRVAVSGGAPLSETVSRFFLAMGIPLVQGYGLTEASPVVSTNRLEDNLPASVGPPIPGVEVRIAAAGEILVRSPGLMTGYWNRPEDTALAIDEEGWLHTGDCGEVIEGRVFIRGRLKEILVTATGEKVSPSDMEAAIVQSPLFEQVMVVGEGMPYVAALIVLNRNVWPGFARHLSLDPEDPASLESPKALRAATEAMAGLLRSFPSYAQVRAVRLALTSWTIPDGLVTPTMKLKRDAISQRFAGEIRKLYEGHDIPE